MEQNIQIKIYRDTKLSYIETYAPVIRETLKRNLIEFLTKANDALCEWAEIKTKPETDSAEQLGF